MKKNKDTKKIKPIEAEPYDESEEIDVEIDIEDDYYEDEIVEENDNDDDIIVEENGEFNIAEESEEQETEYYEDASKTFRRIKTDKMMSIFNIIFVVLIIGIILIGIDVICVGKYNIGPFFAIHTDTYKDGGSKVYYGLGYKVIKYNQIEGRRDTQIGFWNMPYSTEPTQIEDIDLAIEFENNPEETAEKYYKQYLRILTKVKKIDSNENKLLLEYTDPDGKYTLQIDCPLSTKKEKLTNFEMEQKIAVRGTVYKFDVREDEKTNKVYLSDCFAE